LHAVDERRARGDDTLRALGDDWHLVADLQPCGLMIEHEEMGRRNDIDVCELGERAQHELPFAAAEDVVEAGKLRQDVGRGTDAAR